MTAIDSVAKINRMSREILEDSFFRCSGSKIWTQNMLEQLPYTDRENLFAKAKSSWQSLTKTDWLEAFKIHPRIGDVENLRKKFASTASWASYEQSGTSEASELTIQNLARGNREYEERFGFIFIVCATGKSANEMLEILTKRLVNEPETEFLNACEEQKKITDLRLDKL